MSRRNNKKKLKVVDTTKTSSFSGGGNNRRVLKRVGGKGDYAIVKNNSSYINLNKTGSGTSGDPYFYNVNLVDNFTSALADYKTRNNVLEQKIINQKGLLSKQVKTLRNIVTGKNLANIEIEFKFMNPYHSISTKILNNNTSVSFNTSSEPGSSLYKNNCFYIYFKEHLKTTPIVQYNIDNKNLNLDLIELKKEYIKFKIKEINTSNYITYRALSEYNDTKIKFVIEFGYIEKKESNIASSVSVGGSGGSGY